MQSERQERGLQAAETPARSERSEQPEPRTATQHLGSQKKRAWKFARLKQDARFCGLKAALLSP